MKQAILKFVRDERGATAIEYGLIAGLIAAGIIATVGQIGTQLGKIFSYIQTQLLTAKTS
ncbi:Flp family type IVb pilin (plasmid) [Ralstonia sp. 25C]|uniref:Flp family type IVb pilin n=1 Tax=Ralstonia sp. 25C TaxID=3447363 RepID=UPI003F7500BF